MQNVRINIGPQKIETRVSLPASKSLSNRLLIIRALCDDGFAIENLSDADDTKILEQCLQQIHEYRIFSVQDAGTALRFLTAVFAITHGNRLLTGTPRLLERPVGPLVDALNRLGAKIHYFDKKGFPPLVINGSEIRGGKVAVDAGISSQFVSALLLIAPALPEGLEISLKNAVASAPYIRMTLGLMNYFGVVTAWNDDLIKIEPQKYKAKDIFVEADWSAAAFWYEIAALAEDAEIELIGLNEHSLQGDAVVADVFSKLGVQTTLLPDAIKLTKCPVESGLQEFDFFENPDMFPAVIATCVGSGISCRFTGLQNLAIKESDRVTAMLTELEKFGYRFRRDVDGSLMSENSKQIKISQIINCNSYNDHRIAMALSPLSLKGFTLNIDNASCVAKSYPSYFEDIKNAGFDTWFSEND